MAKQAGPLQFTGSIGKLTGFSMNGQYYFKRKTAVSRKKILTHPSYENTRRSFKRFAEAQRIASEIYQEYRRLTSTDNLITVKSIRLRKVWYPLRNRAQELLRKQLPVEKIKFLLREEFISNSRRSILDNHKDKTPTVQKQLTEQSITTALDKELLLGRQPNTELIPKLVDQLAAATLVIKKLIHPHRIQASWRIKDPPGIKM